MDAASVILLIAIVLVVALISYVVWRNPKVKTSVGLGPIRINLDTERTTEQTTPQQATAVHTASQHGRPTAQLSVGNVRTSHVINEGAGGRAEMKAGDIVGSTITNTAGVAKTTHSAKTPDT
ncbi:MAG: hypothetical protein KatS3mg053_1959 [Candidatus Roseilinea sp.]|jgi:hypothetical protein|nr:MAG: hypothetical protein KatS3mg053_1959 [Candidatus Roseilinea sp.]